MWGGVKGHQKPVWYWNQADECSDPSRPCSSCVTLSFSTLPISGTTVCTLQGYCDVLLWLMCVYGNLYNIQEPAIGKWVREGQENQEGIKGQGEITAQGAIITGLTMPQTLHLWSGEGIIGMEEQKENQPPGRFLYRLLSHTTKG